MKCFNLLRLIDVEIHYTSIRTILCRRMIKRNIIVSTALNGLRRWWKNDIFSSHASCVCHRSNNYYNNLFLIIIIFFPGSLSMRPKIMVFNLINGGKEVLTWQIQITNHACYRNTRTITIKNGKFILTEEN